MLSVILILFLTFVRTLAQQAQTAEFLHRTTAVRPISFDLTVKVPIVEPYIGFSASLLLHFYATQPTRTITFHAVDLHSFRNVSLVSSVQNGTTGDPGTKSIRIAKGLVEFEFDRLLLEGQYLLTIGEFNGRIHNGTQGVFYRQIDGKRLIVTHFQPDHARQLLPCIDHPSVKAIYRISIIHPTDTVCQSNMISTDVQVVDQEWQKTVFAHTVKLPSYLFSFSVMPDSHVQLSRQTSFGVTLRVHSTVRAAAIRVLDVALAAFELLNTMMETPLMLNKNWGHILLSESLAATGDDAHLTYVVTHELAHHWIGNKATVNSWQYICLQEDLTDYISFKVLSVLLGNDARYERFRLAKYVEIQLAEDFVSPGHPLILPQEITREMITTHCYLKGSVHLETLEQVVGEDYLLSIIRNLISLYSSFDLETFTKYFDEIVVDQNATLAQIYDYWYTAGGFPTLRVQKNGTHIDVTQSAEKLWPLRLAAPSPLPQFMFAQTMRLPAESAPIIFNLNFTSFYRVNYDVDTWAAIFKYMEDSPLLFSAIGRAQLVSDFCYFHSQGMTALNSTLRDYVIDLVHNNANHFDLCDWNLYWCYASSDVPFFTSVLRKLTAKFSSLFTDDTAFGCRNGHAVRNVNMFCENLFGRRCI